MISPFPFYIFGILAILLAFLALGRWLQGLMGQRHEQPMRVLAAAVLAFVIGSGSIVAGIAFDSEQLAIENTRTFAYAVSVHPGGAVPVLLRLPAPADVRVYNSLNATNGTSHLLLVSGTAQLPFVEVHATRDVAFIVRLEFVGFAFNRTVHRVFLNDLFFRFSSVGNATVELMGDGSGTTTASVRLNILFSEYCRQSELLFDAVVGEGVALYPVTYDVVTTC